MRRYLYLIAGALLFPAVAPQAQAQEYSIPETSYQYVLDLGLGGQFKAKYPGADEYRLSPFPIFGVQRFYVPGVGQVVDGEEKTRSFFIRPSFDFNGRREASDSKDLTGTNPVDWALELGVGAGYRYDWLQGTVEVRQGFNGHSGQVVELGLDIIMQPTEALEFNIGPRLTWASDDYMDTYFGVTGAEASAKGSVLGAYDPDPSFTTAGIEARAIYAVTENTRFHLRAGWERYIGDAADSPIVGVGSENNFSIGAGVSYRFSFDLFNN